MNDLYRALGDISAIRKQVANTTEFRGYGPVTLSVTGALAILAAIAQALWIPRANERLPEYLLLWVGTAAVSLGLTAWQVQRRARRIHSALSQEMIRMAAEQFLPSLAAGLLLTVVLLRFQPQTASMLPGLWQIIFSLGIFSSCRFLPKATIIAPCWYLLCGLICLMFGETQALSPWAMGIPFGAGQLLIAAVLYFGSQEAADEE